MKNGNHRDDIQIGSIVEVVMKKDQKSGKLTRGTVKILTNSRTHPNEIKVMLQEDNIVGRVQNILSE